MNKRRFVKISWILVVAMISMLFTAINPIKVDANTIVHPGLLYSSSDIASLRAMAQDHTVNSNYNVSTGQIWDNVKAAADVYLNEACYTDQGTRPAGMTPFFFYYPYFLPPVSHSYGNSLHIGTLSTLSSWARKPVTALSTNDYYINFDYKAAETTGMSDFQVWASYDGAEYDDVMIKQTGSNLYATNGGGSDILFYSGIDTSVWYNILIHVKTNNTYEIFVNGVSKCTGNQIGTGNLTAIGYLGDVSSNNHDGSGYWDNIRIYSTYTPTYTEYFDNGSLSGWTSYGTAELPNPAVISHGDGSYSPRTYPFWTMLMMYMRERLQNLAFAYVIENNTAYADKAKQIMLSLANWSTWNDPDCPSLNPASHDVMHLTAGVAYAYDMLYSYLTPSERSTIASALKTKGLDPLYSTAVNGGLAYYDGKSVVDNEKVVSNSVMGLGAIALSADYDTSTQLSKARSNLESMYKYACDTDGGWYEGIGYGHFSIFNSLQFHDADKRVNGYDITSNGYLKKASDWALYNMYADGSGFSMVNDCMLTPAYYRPELEYWAKNSINNNAAWALKRNNTLNQASDIFSFLWFPSGITPPSSPSGDLGKLFRDVGYASFRTGWGTNDTFAVLKSGNEYSNLHAQCDTNTIELVKGGSALIAEYGYEDYTSGPRRNFSHGSLGHSVIMVDSQDEAIADGKIDNFFINSKYGYAVGDGKYATGSKMNKWKRTLVNMLGGKYFLLYDDYANDTYGRSVTWRLHTQGFPVSINGDTVSTHKGNDYLNIKVLQPTSPTITTSEDLYSATHSTPYPPKALVVTIPDRTHTYTISFTYTSFASSTISQATDNKDNSVQLAGTTDVDAGFPNGSWLTKTFTLDSSLYDYYTDPGINVKILINDAMYIKSMTLTQVGGSSWTTTPGTSGDDVIASHNPGICFEPGQWRDAFTLNGSTVRGNHRTAEIKMNLASTEAGGNVLALLYPSSDSNMPTATSLNDDQTGQKNVVLVDRSGVKDIVIFTKNSLDPDVLPSAHLLDVGAVNDDVMSYHNPGASIKNDNGRWGSPTTLDGYTVRTSSVSSANMYVNISDTKQVYKFVLCYKTGTSGNLRQYLNPSCPDGGFKVIGNIIGDGKWHMDTFTLDTRYYDNDALSANTNVLLEFTNPISLAYSYSAAIADIDYNDAGGMGDTDSTAHNPGVHLDTGWGSPTTIDGSTVRVGSNPCQLYANIADTDKNYSLVLRYKSSSAGNVLQKGASQFEAIGGIIGDNTWHTDRFRLYPPYIDSNATISGTNVLVKLDTGVTLADAWLELDVPRKTADYCDVGTQNDNEAGNHTAGISVYPAVWGNPATVDGYTVRTSTSSQAPNFYVNQLDGRNIYRVYFRYKSDVDCYVDEWNGSMYYTIGTLTGGNIWRVGSVVLKEFDLDHSPTLEGVNHLLRFYYTNLTLADMWLEYEDTRVIDWNDVGVTGDDDQTKHTPGVSVYPAEWNSPSQVDGLTVRVAPLADANLYVNLLPDTRKTYYLNVNYKASSSGSLMQYNVRTGAYETLSGYTGDNTWRTVRVKLNSNTGSGTPYADYDYDTSHWAANVLFDFSTPITVADAWLEQEN